MRVGGVLVTKADLKADAVFIVTKDVIDLTEGICLVGIWVETVCGGYQGNECSISCKREVLRLMMKGDTSKLHLFAFSDVLEGDGTDVAVVIINRMKPTS